MGEMISDVGGWGTVIYRTGEYLFKQNDASQDLFIIKKGCIRIFKTEGTLPIELDMVGPGMVVGEVASIDNGVRSASGVALEDSEVIKIPAAEFKSILNQIPEYFRKIALILVQRLREVDSRINCSIDGDRTHHVAAIISLIASSDKCTEISDGFQISLKFLENEISDLLNMPLGDVSDILTKLEKRGLLRLERGRVVLPQKDSLDSLAELAFEAASELPTI